ncbi:NAD(P)H-dependent flavin oxidoreductase [Sporosarcina obsidiansis]|uniref:NAD(P)H-dependent flavin oxidoreductase n=1 Tax=Sporosarcina obsidiansis TaxID=2660748 RepID=UPI00129B5F73|nr:nitronate monooxygenase [Sporosarcina obsidiansis]
MSKDTLLKLSDHLTLPIVAAPMFLISSPAMLIDCCLNGVIGSFPASNARTIEKLDEWMKEINQSFIDARKEHEKRKIAPWAINIIVHTSNGRFNEELELVKQHQPPIVITSLGSPKRVVEVVHGYGGIVFSDVSTVAFAKKAAEAKVDGLILVSAGAGGHAGLINGFAFIDSVKAFWDGIILLAGSISTGAGVLAAQAAGADLAYMGTRFIVAKENFAKDAYREMILASNYEDIIYTDAFSGVHSNMLIPSIENVGLDINDLVRKKEISFDNNSDNRKLKAWKDIWSAGHGVGGIETIDSTTNIINQLREEYEESLCSVNEFAKKII